jgi:hypothetical protein
MEGGQPFILFVSEASHNSRIALANLERTLARLGRPKDYVEIADVAEHFELALDLRVMVTPTLLRRHKPEARLIGDLSALTQLEDFLR